MTIVTSPGNLSRVLPMLWGDRWPLS